MSALRPASRGLPYRAASAAYPGSLEDVGTASRRNGARSCAAKTRAGNACRAVPLRDGDYCLAHSSEETRDSVRFGGPQEGSGRPRATRPSDALRERVEADIDRWLRPYEEALEATRTIVVGQGSQAHLEHVPDHRVRMRAAEAVLDRVYGRPRQTGALDTRGGEVNLELDDALNNRIERLADELSRPVPCPSCGFDPPAPTNRHRATQG
jgi:hypothetical protein